MNDEPTPSQAENADEVTPVEEAPVESTDQEQASTDQAELANDSVAQADADVAEPAVAAPVEFSWQASEYVQHHKNGLWYVGVVAIVIILSVAAFFLKSWLSIGVFVAMGAAVIVYAQRPPRTLTYELSADGMRVGERLYPYHDFRSFSVLRDVSWHSIDLEPTKRFMPRLTVLFNDEDFDPIVSHLLEHLPRVDREPDAIERLTRYLRF